MYVHGYFLRSLIFIFERVYVVWPRSMQTHHFYYIDDIYIEKFVKPTIRSFNLVYSQIFLKTFYSFKISIYNDFFFLLKFENYGTEEV